MAFDYDYGIRLDSEGSPTSLAAVSTMVRILPEVYAKQRARPTVVASQHGSVVVARTFYDSFNFVLQVDADYGTPELPATVYDNIATILGRINDHTQRVYLTRIAPTQGDVEIPIMVLREPRTGNPRHRLMIPCRSLEPFWRDQAVTFAAVNPVAGVTTLGSAPIPDAVLVFSGAGTAATLTHTDTGDTLTITGDTTVNAVTVDCGARTIKQSGAHADALLTDTPTSQPWFIELLRNQLNSFTLSSGSVTLTARDRWL